MTVASDLPVAPPGGLIFELIPKIMAEMDAIGKTRDNVQQGFKFRGIEDVYNVLHPLFAKHQVFTLPEVLSYVREEHPTRSGGLMNYTLATIRYTFYARDGSRVSAVVLGEGSDTGDKASNKSMAIAHKYALVQAFIVHTQDAVDADFESYERAPRAPSPSPPTRRSAPEPQGRDWEPGASWGPPAIGEGSSMNPPSPVNPNPTQPTGRSQKASSSSSLVKPKRSTPVVVPAGTPATAPAPTPGPGTLPIPPSVLGLTKGQLQVEIFKSIGPAGWTMDAIRSQMKERFGKSETKDMSIEELEALLTMVKGPRAATK
jgi:hypothetical protein